MLQARGYTIEITQIKKTKYVVFNGKYACSPYQLHNTYSTDFSDNEIIKEVLPTLLKWTGLKPVITLDYP